MFSTAYVADIISDGIQLDPGSIISSESEAWDDYNRKVLATAEELRQSGTTGQEITVRLIRNGDVLAETTIGDGGKFLDTLYSLPT